MKTFRKILSVVLVTVILMLPMTANAVILSGECGANNIYIDYIGDINWTLDTETGVLSFDGEGYMDSFYNFNISQSELLPWWDNLEDIETVVLSEGIKNIGSGVCCGAVNLTSVVVPDSLESVDYNTFYNCKKLESFEFGENFKYLSKCAFFASGLTSIEIPDAVDMIPDQAFQSCQKLRSVKLPANLTYISDMAFNRCSSLENLILPDKLEKIGYYAFEGCSSMKTVTIGENLEYIGLGAFLNCTGITDVYYAGSKEQWEQIEILDLNECLLNAKIHFAKGGEEVDTPDNPAENCSCNCHSGGITNFFWKIINFFQKLFGKNKVCACGVKH